jgi:hypothetical protein
VQIDELFRRYKVKIANVSRDLKKGDRRAIIYAYREELKVLVADRRREFLQTKKLRAERERAERPGFALGPARLAHG